LLTILLPAAGCSGSHALVRQDTAGLAPLVWFAPALPADRSALDRWSSGVGPPVVDHHATQTAGSGIETLVVVSWNTALGSGRVDDLVRTVRRTYGDAPLVLLLQEVYRNGPEVPSALPAKAAFAAKLGGGRDRQSGEIEAVAARLSMNLYYVPSMRNGPPLISDEDRGNAILSTLPLHDLAAIELPFERQRRVAVAATVAGTAPDGIPWAVRLVSAHLDNMVGPRRLWIAGSEFARARQARALKDYLADPPAAVLGADLNTWFGFSDLAYGELAPAFPDTRVVDRRATFRGLLRLDHLFFRLPDGWTAQFARDGDRYGSDHHPLVGVVELPAAPAASPGRE
jgi:endonuclease/exonuclease/phosphatase family metal-dependent hydrolase